MYHAIARLQQGVETVQGYRKICAWILGVSILVLGSLLWLIHNLGLFLSAQAEREVHRPIVSIVWGVPAMFCLYPAPTMLPLLKRAAKPIGLLLFTAA